MSDADPNTPDGPLSHRDLRAATADLFDDLRVYTMPFGRYKGAKLHHLPLPYLLWFQHQGFPAGRLGELMQEVCTIKSEGAEFLLGGDKATVGSDIAGGFYVQPTLLKGSNDMRVFQEEIFGPTLGITTFKDEAEALAIANATEYGLGAGVWTRDTNRAFRMGRGIQAGRVWMNCYHAYPAHAAFGGYKKSGIGRETHKVALDHYQQTKNLLVSYDTSPLGFF